MLLRVILQCETPTKFTPELRPRRVGPKRRGRACESGSRFVDIGYERPVDVSVSIPKSPPPSRRNVDRRNDPQPRPTSAASRTKPRACIWTSMFPALCGVSDTSASVRLKVNRSFSENMAQNVHRRSHRTVRVGSIQRGLQRRVCPPTGG